MISLHLNVVLISAMIWYNMVIKLTASCEAK